mmetsp:Transcript_40682/g.121578  ORF Transcript_40682/g.121578 Transcript_40682/m.121578 type:complete len:240 (+) Transcript_40682:562-1281(+)
MAPGSPNGPYRMKWTTRNTLLMETKSACTVAILLAVADTDPPDCPPKKRIMERTRPILSNPTAVYSKRDARTLATSRATTSMFVSRNATPVSLTSSMEKTSSALPLRQRAPPSTPWAFADLDARTPSSEPVARSTTRAPSKNWGLENVVPSMSSRLPCQPSEPSISTSSLLSVTEAMGMEQARSARRALEPKRSRSTLALALSTRLTSAVELAIAEGRLRVPVNPVLNAKTTSPKSSVS